MVSQQGILVRFLGPILTHTREPLRAPVSQQKIEETFALNHELLL